MRNLKRALSLALAFVMVMSLMIVGTSAKSYTDADKIDNQVAVEILGELGVMIGNDDGSFAPDRDVTRAEMAVLITRILYGNNMNVDQFKNMNTFTDVPDWAEGFVNLCASLDIIAGRGNGIFDPDATVTSAEAALMLSRALGYFKNNAEFGNDWALAAMKRATQAGIIGGDMVLQANAGLDRDDVAQMTFNTLTKAVPVQYNELLDVYYNVNQGIIYALEFNYLQTLGFTNFGLVYKNNEQTIYGRPATTWGIGSYKDAGKGTASGIEKAELTDQGGLIASNVRMLDKDQIITVANTPDYVYTKDTAEEDVYDDLGATLCNDAKGQTSEEEYTWTAFINGKEVKAEIPEKNESGDYTYTAKGSVVEVYVDDYDQTVTVVEINYYLGQVTKAEDGVITVKELSEEPTLNVDTFASEDFSEDDYVVFTVDFNDDDDYYICELMAPETATGDVVRVDKDNNSSDTYIRLDSTTGDKYYYTSEDHMAYDVTVNGDSEHPDLNEEYTLYMTPAGYVLGFEPTAESVDQYLYVMDSDENLRDWNAKVVLPDATQPNVSLDEDLDNISVDDDGDSTTPYPFTYTVGTAEAVDDDMINDTIDWMANSKDSVNVSTAAGDEVAKNELDLTNIDFLIWNYSVNSSDVYSLEYVTYLDNDDTAGVRYTYQSRMYGANINNGDAYVDNRFNDTYFIIDKNTVFVDTVNDAVYNGYNEVPNIENATLAYVVDDGVAQIVYILEGEVYNENSIYFFLTSTDRETEKYDGDYYWEYEDAYVDGKNQPLMVSYNALVDDVKVALRAGVLYKATKTIDDVYITEVKIVGIPDVTGDENHFLNVTEPQYVGGDAFSVEANAWTDWNPFKYTTNDDTVFVKVEREAKNIGNYEKALYNHVAYTDGFEWSVSTGRISDMDDSRLEDYVLTYVTVAESDDNVAELVYIYQITPDYNGVQFTVTVKDGMQADVTESVINGGTVTIDYTAPAGYYVASVDKGTYANGKITLTNVTADTTINVTLTKAATTEVRIVEDNIYTANEDSNPILVGQAIEQALTEAGYTDVSYTIQDGKVMNISGKIGGGTVNFKYLANEEGEGGASNKVAFLEDGESIATAVSAGAETVYLTDGNFTMDAKVNGNLTIIGDSNTVLTSTTANTADYAGLYVTAGNLVVKNVTFTTDDKEANNTRGIVTAPSYTGTITIENCTFDGVISGIYVNDCAGGTIKGCTFKNCTAGIGIDYLTGILEVNNCVFSDNAEDIGVTSSTGHSSKDDVKLIDTTATIQEH